MASSAEIRAGSNRLTPPIILPDEIGTQFKPEKTKMPHGGGCHSLARYQSFPYSTYTEIDEEVKPVEIFKIWGYRCNDCGFTFFLDDVFTEMEKAIEAAPTVMK